MFFLAAPRQELTAYEVCARRLTKADFQIFPGTVFRRSGMRSFLLPADALRAAVQRMTPVVRALQAR